MTIKKTLFRLINDYLFNNHSKIKINFLILFWLIISAVAILEPFFMKELISLVENYIKTWNYDFNSFVYVFVFWIIFIILVLLFKWFYEYLVDSTLLFSYNKIYIENAEKFLYMSYNDFLEKKQWTTFKIFDRWMEFWYFFTEQLLTRLLDSIFGILIIVSILFYVDYRMALITLAMVPAMIYIWFFVNKKTSELQTNINEIRDDAYWNLWNAVWNLWLVKTLTLEKTFLKILNKKLFKAYSRQIKITKRLGYIKCLYLIFSNDFKVSCFIYMNIFFD